MCPLFFSGRTVTSSLSSCTAASRNVSKSGYGLINSLAADNVHTLQMDASHRGPALLISQGCPLDDTRFGDCPRDRAHPESCFREEYCCVGENLQICVYGKTNDLRSASRTHSTVIIATLALAIAFAETKALTLSTTKELARLSVPPTDGWISELGGMSQ